MTLSRVFQASLSQQRAARAERLPMVPFFPLTGKPAVFQEEARLGGEWGVVRLQLPVEGRPPQLYGR